MIEDQVLRLTSEYSPFHFSLGCGNFDWTVDKSTAIEMLSVYSSQGGNFLDTSDSYGDSEVFIGEFFDSKNLISATKVGDRFGFDCLTLDNLLLSVRRSTQRLGIDCIQVYFAHKDDEQLSIKEIYHNFLTIYDLGLIRYAGISNFSEKRLYELLKYQASHGKRIFALSSYGYSLVDRLAFEFKFAPILREFEVPLMPFFPLAKGFLTSEYTILTPKNRYSKAHGGTGNSEYRSIKNFLLKRRLSTLANSLGVTPQEIALAFVKSRDFVFIPIAGARTLKQLSELFTEVSLCKSDISYLIGED
jgi:aryl-alcohol dehydrogenase-like predicted oxidoreductase